MVMGVLSVRLRADRIVFRGAFQHLLLVCRGAFSSTSSCSWVARYVYDRADAGSVIDEKLRCLFNTQGRLCIRRARRPVADVCRLSNEKTRELGFRHSFLWAFFRRALGGALWHTPRRTLSQVALSQTHRARARHGAGHHRLSSHSKRVSRQSSTPPAAATLASRFASASFSGASPHFCRCAFFLMVQPPFHPLEIATAIAAYVWLFKAAIE
jgi:hypothetical protein